MKMDRMVEYLENRGFKAEKRYITKDRVYEFTIIKDGIEVKDHFNYPSYAKDGYAVDRIQRDFLEKLLDRWSLRNKEFEMYDCGIPTVQEVFDTLSPRQRTAVYMIIGEAIHEEVYSNPAIKNVIFNNPATIVLWKDGTKTVVKCQDGDDYDPEKGLAMAITKKALGNKGNYCNEFNKWMDKYYETHNWEVDIPRSVKIHQEPFRRALDETWVEIRKSFEKAMMSATSTAESTKQFREIMDRRVEDVKNRKNKDKEEKE